LRKLAPAVGAPLASLLGPEAEKALAVALSDAEEVAALADQVPEVLAAVSRGTGESTESENERRRTGAARWCICYQVTVSVRDVFTAYMRGRGASTGGLRDEGRFNPPALKAPARSGVGE